MARADLYERIRRKTPVPVTERDLERALLAAAVARDLWEFADRSDVPLAALPAIVEALQHAGLIERSAGRLELTPSGQEQLRSQGLLPPWQVDCPACAGRGLDLRADAPERLLERFRQITGERPEPRADFDQAYMTPESTVARVALMGRRGDLVGKRLIVLGDDDLVGLAAALSGAPRRVTIFEIDEAIVDFVNGVKAHLGLDALEIQAHDLSHPLPDAHLGAYDAFLSDPPEGLEACTLFLTRGLAALQGVGSAGYFGLSRREASLDKWKRIQKWLIGRGGCITDCLDDFSDYVNWPYWREMRLSRWLGIEAPPQGVWYRSTMIRFELIEARAVPNEPFAGSFEDPESATT